MLEQTVNSAKLHFLQNLSVWKLPASEHDYLAEALALCEEISKKGDESDFSCSTNGCTYCPYQYLCKKTLINNEKVNYGIFSKIRYVGLFSRLTAFLSIWLLLGGIKSLKKPIRIM